MLIGLSAAAFRPVMMVEGVAVQGITEANIEEMSTKLASKAKWFRNILGADHEKIEWRSVFDFPDKALVREARSADLIVIGWSSGPSDAYSLPRSRRGNLSDGASTLLVP